MQEILPDVFTWSWFSERHGYDFNGHLIRHAEDNICIDPVPASASDMETLTRLGVGRILISNRNHSRAANAVRSETGAATAIHPDDAEHARRAGMVVDATLRPGERAGPLTVVAAPGKSPGEVAFHWPERGVLIVGDAVIGNPPGRLALLPERVVDDPACLRRSVRALLELDFDVLLLGDGVSILEDAKQPLQELVATFPD
ncbi:MAG: MBL fold metallo-hydrolase [Gammaproteobacteria bacterium]|nr:MBL fold metallo-hydrolase [Gammaproteobacteria bacterium]NIR88850.1 MBL fold metallo-hydrolase [Gammaproteobacteria bacterium]NIU06454.1 MBL fold metallo-hydrolase [Gammaproteobacteria bacterium]NIV53346.1 MBL fold metallo-hydrolase [Gammaproteobacteria bacterium]NIV74065.1 MBL fold metallo-hydrolase [Gammaproteobacteria bacterium]